MTDYEIAKKILAMKHPPENTPEWKKHQDRRAIAMMIVIFEMAGYPLSELK
jgi:hypothetical protein